MTLTTYKWTIAQYHKAIEAGIFDREPLELLNGDLILMPPEREPHAYYNDKAAEYLRQLLGSQAKVREGKPITLPNNSEPLPDIAIVAALEEVYLQHHPFPENIYWLIEFASATLSKDLREKKAIYEAAAIREYWVVNLIDSQLHIFRDWQAGEYTTELIYTRGVVYPLAFPELAVRCDRVLPPT